MALARTWNRVRIGEERRWMCAEVLQRLVGVEVKEEAGGKEVLKEVEVFVNFKKM
jgi:hypothetical protein